MKLFGRCDYCGVNTSVVVDGHGVYICKVCGWSQIQERNYRRDPKTFSHPFYVVQYLNNYCRRFRVRSIDNVRKYGSDGCCPCPLCWLCVLVFQRDDLAYFVDAKKVATDGNKTTEAAP
ncbi:MAG: hypothetical protein WC325_12870 [Candidatus Bathyarchaeia archaeon]